MKRFRSDMVMNDGSYYIRESDHEAAIAEKDKQIAELKAEALDRHARLAQAQEDIGNLEGDTDWHEIAKKAEAELADLKAELVSASPPYYHKWVEAHEQLTRVRKLFVIWWTTDMDSSTYFNMSVQADGVLSEMVKQAIKEAGDEYCADHWISHGNREDSRLCACSRHR